MRSVRPAPAPGRSVDAPPQQAPSTVQLDLAAKLAALLDSTAGHGCVPVCAACRTVLPEVGSLTAALAG